MSVLSTDTIAQREHARARLAAMLSLPQNLHAEARALQELKISAAATLLNDIRAEEAHVAPSD